MCVRATGAPQSPSHSAPVSQGASPWDRVVEKVARQLNSCVQDLRLHFFLMLTEFTLGIALYRFLMGSVECWCTGTRSIWVGTKWSRRVSLCEAPLGQRPCARIGQQEGWFQSWVSDLVFCAGCGRSSVEAWYTALDIEEVLSGVADSDVHLFVADVILSCDTVDTVFWIRC